MTSVRVERHRQSGNLTLGVRIRWTKDYVAPHQPSENVGTTRDAYVLQHKFDSVQVDQVFSEHLFFSRFNSGYRCFSQECDKKFKMKNLEGAPRPETKSTFKTNQ